MNEWYTYRHISLEWCHDTWPQVQSSVSAPSPHQSGHCQHTHRIEESFLAQLCSPVVTLEDPAEGNVSAQLWLHLRLVSLFPLDLIGSPRWKLYTVVTTHNVTLEYTVTEIHTNHGLIKQKKCEVLCVVTHKEYTVKSGCSVYYIPESSCSLLHPRGHC